MSQAGIYSSEQEKLVVDEWDEEMNSQGWRFESPTYWNLSSSQNTSQEVESDGMDRPIDLPFTSRQVASFL